MKKKTIKDAQFLASQKNGKCLSKTMPKGTLSRLEWECKEGHRWNALYYNIKTGHWCPRCAIFLIRKPKKYDTQFYEEYAKSKGGKYCGRNGLRAEWECERGHKWIAELKEMLRQNKRRRKNWKQSGWCPECASENHIIPIEVAQKVAQDNLGKCLSQTNETNKKLLWECEKGHKWEASLNNVKNNHSWCPFCCQGYNENKFREVIEGICGLSFPKKRPDWLKNKNKNNMEIDGYNETYKLGFEYQGIQHFKYISYMQKTEKKFREQISNDKKKKKIFSKRGIKMMYPDYTIPAIKFKDFIIDFLRKHKLSKLIKHEGKI